MSMLYVHRCSVRLTKLFLALGMTNMLSQFYEVKIEQDMTLQKNTEVWLYSLIKDGDRLM